ncbi:phage tail protein, partial [Salmonella enterica subsp. enterica serovar Montevideo]|nr:phage tail protein [Salmonella enterica subsp. enterica serovar Montevideo]
PASLAANGEISAKFASAKSTRVQ